MNHSVSLHVQLICFYTFCLILFLLRAFTNIYIIYVYICGSSEKIEVQIFSCCFVLFFVFVNGHNIQSLHKVPSCETNQKGPTGQFPKQLRGSSANRMPVSDIILHSSLSSPLFLQEKKVDPNDFSPRIKQETIITVEFMFF